MDTQNSKGKKHPPGGAFTDWHCHILPGIDDGAGDLAEALEIAGILAGAGFAEVYCTPHCIRGLYDNTAQIVRRAVGELQAAIEAAGIKLRLHAGMEYYLDEYFARQLSDPLPLGDSSYLLVETPAQADPDKIKEQLFAIRRRGFTPLIAHPERHELFAVRQAKEKKGALGRLKRKFSGEPAVTGAPPALLPALHEMGCRFQGNLGSFAGVYGSEVKTQAERLLAAGYYFCVGSDAHRAKSLDKMLSRGLARTGASHSGGTLCAAPVSGSPSGL